MNQENNNINNSQQPTMVNPDVSPVNNGSNLASTTSLNTTNHVQSAAPTPMSQQHVQLVNDKPAIQAIMPMSGTPTPPVASGASVTPTATVAPVAGNAGSGTSQTESGQTKKKGGKLQTFFLIVLFGGLLVMIIFLPDISNYIETQRYLKTHVEEKITTGTLKCTLEKSSIEMDYVYDLAFAFNKSRLNELTYLLKIKGDMNLDSEKLDSLAGECNQLSTNAKSLDGISVACSYEFGVVTQKQMFNYSAIDEEAAISAYIEAGGIYPDYENNESIDEIEKKMNASGYTCERVK